MWELLPNSVYTGQVVQPFVKRPEITLSNRKALTGSLRSLCQRLRLTKQSIGIAARGGAEGSRGRFAPCATAHWHKASLGRCAPKALTGPFASSLFSLTAGKSGWHVAYPAAATRCLCSLRSPCNCLWAHKLRTRAHDTRTRARTFLLINCSCKIVASYSKNVTIENVTLFVT